MMYYLGSLGAADEFKLDYILNITADCPFVDPIYADKIVEEYFRDRCRLNKAV